MPGVVGSLPPGERMCQPCRRARQEPKPPRKASPTCSECPNPVIQPARGRTRTYCTDDCKAARDRRMKKALPRPYVCIACAAQFEFQGTGNPRRCTNCRTAGIVGPPRECIECGQLFWPHLHPAKLCDRPTCQLASLRKRAKLAQAALSIRPPISKVLLQDTGKGNRYRLELSQPGLSRGQRHVWLQRQIRRGARCAYCGAKPSTHDHVIPLHRGGTNFEGNLAPACRGCNTRKARRTVMEWRLNRKVRRL